MSQGSIELARQEALGFRSVLIELDRPGIRVSAQDCGSSTKIVGSDDGELEFWVDVPTEALQRLAAILIRDRFSGSLEAVSEFRRFCEDNEIPHHFMIWS